jgi:hypothetical protein
MSRRLTIFVLATFYLLQSTWLLHAGMDLLFPRVRTILANSEASCTGACGCPKETKELKDCCCVKHAGTRTPSQASTPISSIEEAKCKGLDEAMTQAFTQPAVCGFAGILFEIAVSSDLRLPELHPPYEFTPTALDKVPIAQA